MKKIRIIFSGAGGQGLVTSAILLAETAIFYSNLNAVQSQSYGAEVRGGTTRSDVIISDSKIFFPKIIQPNILVCLTQEAYNKFRSIIRPGGTLITDTKYPKIEKKLDACHVELPMFQAVMEHIGDPIVYNICVLGALIRLTHLVHEDAILKVLEKRLPKSALNKNQKALKLGMELMGRKK